MVISQPFVHVKRQTKGQTDHLYLNYDGVGMRPIETSCMGGKQPLKVNLHNKGLDCVGNTKSIVKSRYRSFKWFRVFKMSIVWLSVGIFQKSDRVSFRFHWVEDVSTSTTACKQPSNSLYSNSLRPIRGNTPPGHNPSPHEGIPLMGAHYIKLNNSSTKHNINRQHRIHKHAY